MLPSPCNFLQEGPRGSLITARNKDSIQYSKNSVHMIVI
jgi:hypothetical protein